MQKLALQRLKHGAPGSTHTVSPGIEAKLGEYMALEPNWDGYNGQATDPKIAGFAEKTLAVLMGGATPDPVLAPGGDGTVQAEWRNDRYTIEFHFISENKIDASRKVHETGKWEEVRIEAGNLSKAVEWVRAMNSATTE